MSFDNFLAGIVHVSEVFQSVLCPPKLRAPRAVGGVGASSLMTGAKRDTGTETATKNAPRREEATAAGERNEDSAIDESSTHEAVECNDTDRLTSACAPISSINSPRRLVPVAEDGTGDAEGYPRPQKLKFANVERVVALILNRDYNDLIEQHLFEREGGRRSEAEHHVLRHDVPPCARKLGVAKGKPTPDMTILNLLGKVGPDDAPLNAHITICNVQNSDLACLQFPSRKFRKFDVFCGPTLCCTIDERPGLLWKSHSGAVRSGMERSW